MAFKVFKCQFKDGGLVESLIPPPAPPCLLYFALSFPKLSLYSNNELLFQRPLRLLCWCFFFGWGKGRMGDLSPPPSQTFPCTLLYRDMSESEFQINTPLKQFMSISPLCAIHNMYIALLIGDMIYSFMSFVFWHCTTPRGTAFMLHVGIFVFTQCQPWIQQLYKRMDRNTQTNTEGGVKQH